MYRSFDSFVSCFADNLSEIITKYNNSEVFIKSNSELNKVVLFQTLYLHLENTVNANINSLNSDSFKVSILEDSLITQLCNQLNIRKVRILQFLNLPVSNITL